MTKPPSEKQAEFRASLMRKALVKAQAAESYGTPGVTSLDVDEAARRPSPDDWYLDTRGQKIAGLAFALAMPEPSDSADCSEQIDALKSGDGWLYARLHEDWGKEILARIAARWGNDPAALPKIVTVAELRAVATGASNA
jgi:hypothetical protein